MSAYKGFAGSDGWGADGKYGRFNLPELGLTFLPIDAGPAMRAVYLDDGFNVGLETGARVPHSPEGVQTAINLLRFSDAEVCDKAILGDADVADFVIEAASRGLDCKDGKLAETHKSSANAALNQHSEATFKYGTGLRADGPWKGYSKYGHSLKGRCKDGHLDGDFEKYYDGELLRKGSYKDGLRVGEWRDLRESHLVERSGVFYSVCGARFSGDFYDGMSAGSFENGLKNGLWVYWKVDVFGDIVFDKYVGYNNGKALTSLQAQGAVEKKQLRQFFADKSLTDVSVEVEAVQCRVKPGRYADIKLVRKDHDKPGHTYHPRRWDLNVHLSEESNPTGHSFTVWGYSAGYALLTSSTSYLFEGQEDVARFNRRVSLETISDIVKDGWFIFYKWHFDSRDKKIVVKVTNPEKIKECLFDNDMTVHKLSRFGFIWDK